MLHRLFILLLLALLSACSNVPLEPLPHPTQQPDVVGKLPKTAGSFSTAKRLLYEQVYAGHQKTFYCGCTFTKTNRVYLGSCNANYRKNEARAKRLEAEHIFPASHFGKHRACWYTKACTDSQGKAYGGRRCCQKIDPHFEAAHNDLHNLQPVIGELNADRSNFSYAQLNKEQRQYGECDFDVDFSTKRVEPPLAIRGDIARTYFYMRDIYNIRLSKQQEQLFTAWNHSDPVDQWERERNRRIKSIQGIGNHYITQ